MTLLNNSIILASGSSARRVLLEESGLIIQVRPVDLDEEALRQQCESEGKSLGDTALALADAKARLAADVSSDTSLIIAADQILDLDGTAFAKPQDINEAKTHLKCLRNRTHTLQTAVVLYRGTQKIWETLATPQMTMRPFSDEFLDLYLKEEGDRILSCVGAYRLEGLGIQLFSKILGDQDAILGLPRLSLLEKLRQENVILA
ncbi:Maf family protein [Gluconobacter cerinus]|uniref:Maf family protein n=1 Tax=Gluconobacter cerinus TaxID=38307 RepID=UPI001B8D8EF3|nr:Maf family protein [Gluconobacter cerinus]MBS1030746.1 Maf family protein [Gluconobacter cerinus]